MHTAFVFDDPCPVSKIVLDGFEEFPDVLKVVDFKTVLDELRLLKTIVGPNLEFSALSDYSHE